MQHENDLQGMTVADLAQRCAEETKNYFQQQRHETGYCFELFRRAVVTRDNEAWEAVYAQYKPQVERWVYRHPDFALVDEEAQDFTIQAFARFSKYFTDEKFSNSKSLAGILSYLQMCVNGAILDCLRKIRYEQIEMDETLETRKDLNPVSTPEELLQGEELWQLIQKRLKNEKEQIVVYASGILGLTPKQILAEYPDAFRDTTEVSQCKANVFARLARDPEIRKFLRWDD
jgi:RNA polymerase sigma factor (sigma-70 family)